MIFISYYSPDFPFFIFYFILYFIFPHVSFPDFFSFFQVQNATQSIAQRDPNTFLINLEPYLIPKQEQTEKKKVEKEQQQETLKEPRLESGAWIKGRNWEGKEIETPLLRSDGVHLTIESQELLGRLLAGEVGKVIKERELGERKGEKGGEKAGEKGEEKKK